MSKLHFQLNFRSNEMRTVDLPVEIRKRNSALVARSLSSQSIDVEPGTYYVTVRLPAGQELAQKVEVRKDRDAYVTLTPEFKDRSAQDLSADASLEVQNFMVRPLSQSHFSELESLGAEQNSHNHPRLRLFAGNLLRREQKQIEPISPHLRPLILSSDLMQFDGDFQGMTLTAQLLQSNKPAINLALPATEQRGYQLTLRRLPEGGYEMNAHLHNTVADSLLWYRGSGQLEQLATVADSEALSAEQLLNNKMQDPVAAAVGAYALLRLNDLEKLHLWTENLKNWFPWLPDGLAIQAEHLARLGDHEQALALFVQLPSRGLPLFSSGVSYALNRLRFYVDIGERHFKSEQLDQARSLSTRLQDFASYMDFNKSITTYTGIRPDSPDRENVSEDLTDYNGLDVEHLFS